MRKKACSWDWCACRLRAAISLQFVAQLLAPLHGGHVRNPQPAATVRVMRCVFGLGRRKGMPAPVAATYATPQPAAPGSCVLCGALVLRECERFSPQPGPEEPAWVWQVNLRTAHET